MLRNESVSRVRVVLADDHTLVLEAFSALLADQVNVVGTAEDGRQLIKVVRETKPEVVVTDINMPGLNGLDACARLSKNHADLRIIVLTVSEEPERVAQALRAGAHGYLLKRSAASELVDAIEAVAGGTIYVTPQVKGREAEKLMAANCTDTLEQLTIRQREVLQLLAEGRNMREAARILNVTPRTVAFHKYRLMKTLGIDSNADLVRYAYESGLVA